MIILLRLLRFPFYTSSGCFIPRKLHVVRRNAFKTKGAVEVRKENYHFTLHLPISFLLSRIVCVVCNVCFNCRTRLIINPRRSSSWFLVQRAQLHYDGSQKTSWDVFNEIHDNLLRTAINIVVLFSWKSNPRISSSHFTLFTIILLWGTCTLWHSHYNTVKGLCVPNLEKFLLKHDF